jgi:hypothetical protein
MKNKQQKFVDKVYRLTRNAAPLSFMLPTKNSSRSPLMWFDEEKGFNRALRYARNQKSPFEDEQDGNFILEPVIFENGLLRVSKENQVLQQFLHYHPMNGKKFIEVNNEKDASQEVEYLNYEVDALIEARNLDVAQLENVCRVLFGKNVSKMSTAELKRDVLVFAKRDPRSFLEAIKDPELMHSANIQRFFDDGMLTTRRNDSEVWYNTPTNKTKMLTIPYGQDKVTAASTFLKSDDGLEALTMLEALIEY